MKPEIELSIDILSPKNAPIKLAKTDEIKQKKLR